MSYKHLGEGDAGLRTFIRARKDYICAWCQKPIRKGEKYSKYLPFWKHWQEIERICAECAFWAK